MGLLLERDSAVLMSIAKSIVDLGSQKRLWVVDTLCAVNRRIKFNFEEAIVEWALGNAITGVEGFSESAISRLGDISLQASAIVSDWLAIRANTQHSVDRTVIGDSFSELFRSIRARSELIEPPNLVSLSRNVESGSQRHQLATGLLAAVLSSSVGGPWARLQDRLSYRLRILGVRKHFGARLARLVGNLVESMNPRRMIVYLWWLADANLSYSRFANLHFVESTMRRANFTGSILINADLSLADLRDAKFRNTRLRQVDFGSADLAGADFSGCTILRNVKLGYAKIDDRTNFRDCNWWSADFYWDRRGISLLRVNNELLNSMFERLGSDIEKIEEPNEIHSSVQYFMKRRGLWKFGTSKQSSQ